MKKKLFLVFVLVLFVVISCDKKSDEKDLSQKTETHKVENKDVKSCESGKPNGCANDIAGSCENETANGCANDIAESCESDQECDSDLIEASSEKAENCCHNEISWSNNIDSALEEAATSGKLLMIDFMATWCPPCRQMDKLTFSNADVIAKAKKFVTVRIDVDKQPEVANAYNGNANKYGGVGIPNILFLDKDKKVKRHIIGFHESEKLISVMDSVLTGKYDK